MSQEEKKKVPSSIIQHFTAFIDQGYTIGLHGADASGTLRITEHGKLIVTDSDNDNWKSIEDFVKNELGAEEHLVELAQLVERVVTSRYLLTHPASTTMDRATAVKALTKQVNANAIEDAGAQDAPEMGPSQ